MDLHYCAITLDGNLKRRKRLDDASLDAAVITRFTERIQTHAGRFREVVAIGQTQDLEVDFQTAGSVAAAFFRAAGEMAAVTVLLSGTESKLVSGELHKILDLLLGWVPARRIITPLLDLTERPLVLSFAVSPLSPGVRDVVEETELRLGAAFFGTVASGAD